MNRKLMIGGLLLTAAGVCPAQVHLTGATVVTFASAEEGRRILTARDDYIQALSPFDRAARVKTDGTVSEKEFLEFVGANVLDWTQGEKAAFTRALEQLRAPLDRLALPWPQVIWAIKTTGEEEGGAAYTRDQAVILPPRFLSSPRGVSPRLLAHELFHILSRSNPALRERLYETIGFAKCGPVEWPASLRDRRITNPDAPGNDHCIRVQVDGADAWAVPIIFSRAEKYDVQRGGGFFRYLQFQLLLVDRADDAPAMRPILADGQPRLVDIEQVSGFFEQVGRNTQYLIHPEEILADNFAALVMQDQKVPSPEILERLQKALTAKPPEK